MIADQMLIGTWQTPGGHSATFGYRDLTNDWNTVTSCLTNDEYGLRMYSVEGTALDVGAHIGAVTVALALDNPSLHVVAIEPVPENLAILSDNVQRNGVADQVTILEGAVGTSRIEYGLEGSELATHHQWIGNAANIPGSHRHSIEVARWTLDDLPAPSFVKIDCEGGEWGFFDDPAVAAIPRIVGELHDIGRGFRPEFAALFTKSHDIIFAGPPEGACSFLAMRRDPA